MSLTGDRGQEPRRRFLKTVTGLLGGLVTAVAAIPGLALVLHPLRRDTARRERPPRRVARLRQLAPMRPLRVDVRGELIDAWSRIPDVKLGSCWLVRGAEAGASTEPPGGVRAFSTVCPHRGCNVEHDEAREQFVCPCHRSFFSLAGKRLEGPSPRDLDELPVTIEGGEVKVAYQRFRVGLPTKEEV
jgi:menaquinol-cytochrome c reductase iron-sulfur subunit